MRWRIWRRTFGHEGRRLRSLHPSSNGTFPIHLRVTAALAITHVVWSSVQHHCQLKTISTRRSRTTEKPVGKAYPHNPALGNCLIVSKVQAGPLGDTIHNGTISHPMRMRSQIWICCSFVDRKGHNLIEAAYGTCVLLIEQLVFGHLHPMDS